MEHLDEQEITKKMLNSIRRPLITENVNRGSDEEELDAGELADEQAGFRDAVSPRVDFISFKVYPKTKNVVFSGKFENMGGLEWQFTLEDADGLYITANNVPLTDNNIITIKKLKGYYDNWADEWAKKLATEYNRDSESGGDEVQKTESV